MGKWIRSRNAINMHLQDLASRIIAESGIPTDRYHLGKLILQGLKDAPDYLLQIDGSTGETEYFESTMKRSIRCATAFRKLGIIKGDVIILMAPHHIHLCIPMYAAFYTGAIVAGIDMNMKSSELKDNFSMNKPSIIFCQSNKAGDVNLALSSLNIDAKIVTFDNGPKYLNFTEFIDKYGDDTPSEQFKVTDLDPNETIALLISTSGTTGLPKSAAATHTNFSISAPNMWVLFDKCPSPTRLSVILSPIQWYSAIFQYVFSPIVRNTRLQSSLPITQEHAYYIINKYKPSFTMSSVNMLSILFKKDDNKKCDLSCFDHIIASGSAIPPTFSDVINAVSPKTCFIPAYGLSEISGIAFIYDSTNPRSIGRPAPIHEVRLVATDTKQEVTEANTPGELWIKGPAVFKGYYNKVEDTKNTFSVDGWFKTGDVFIRDEQWYFYFIERIKMLMIYKNHQVSPVEIENVIIKHPAVFAVAVTSVPHPEDGDLPVACVVPHKNMTVTAEEIKDMVAEILSEPKHLSGGVIFLEELPMTSTSKVSKTKLATLAVVSERL